MAAAHRRDCEEWASCMLIPAASLIDGFALFRHLPEIAAWLDVDLPTLRMRLRTLSDDEQDDMMDAIRRFQSAAA